MQRRRTLYRDAALADGQTNTLRMGVSVLVEDDKISWMRPSDAEEDPGKSDGLDVVDASGSTIVPGMVDAHSHLTMPGGAHWIDRALDPTVDLLGHADRCRQLSSPASAWLWDFVSIRSMPPA